jgi:hypothetical protein
MTAVAEIESAIQQLTAAQLKELAAWFEEYQQMIGARLRCFRCTFRCTIRKRELAPDAGLSVPR